MEKLKNWLAGHKAMAGVIAAGLLALVYIIVNKMMSKPAARASAAPGGMVYSPPATTAGGGSQGTGGGADLAAIGDMVKEAQLENQKGFMEGMTGAISSLMGGIKDTVSGQNQAITGFMGGVRDTIADFTGDMQNIIAGQNRAIEGVQATVAGQNRTVTDMMNSFRDTISNLTARITSTGASQPTVPTPSGSTRRAPDVYIEPRPSRGSRSGATYIEPVQGVEYGSSGVFGNSGQGGQAEQDANERRLASDSSYVQQEIARTLAVIANRTQAGLDVSAQNAYLTRLRT